MAVLPVARVTGRRSKHDVGTGSGGGAFCILLLLLVGLVEIYHSEVQALRGVPNQQTEVSASICTPDENGASTCTCTDSKTVLRDVQPEPATDALKTAVLKFSGSTNSLKLTCDHGQIPSATNNSDKVCPTSVDLVNCTGDKTPPDNSVSIASFLVGDGKESIKWVKSSGEDGNSHTLTIPGANLPLSPKEFAVGCLDGTKKAVCKVTVKLEKLSTTTDNTVECAYGPDSGENRQQVTLSPTQNSLTLICGEGAAVQPTDYKTTFCSTGDASDTCSETYESIFPHYEKSWWTEPASPNSTVKLEIPADDFPEDEKKIVVGCKYTVSSDKKGQSTATQSFSCNVDVTITANPMTPTSGANLSSPWCSVAPGVLALIAGFYFL